MAVLPVGKEGWKEGQYKIAALTLRLLGVYTSTIGLEGIKNCESVISVTRCY